MVLLNDLWAGESEPNKKEQLVVTYVGVRGSIWCGEKAYVGPEYLWWLGRPRSARKRTRLNQGVVHNASNSGSQ
jgi:hypothetical protein